MSKQGVKHLLVAVDVFSQFFRVQIIKTKYAKDTLQAFKKNITRENTPEKIWVDKKTDYGRNQKLRLQREPFDQQNI